MNAEEGFVELRWYNAESSWRNLEVAAAYRGFAGTGRRLVYEQQIREFADGLDRYPLPAEPVTLQSTDGNQFDDEQVIISLAVRPVGGRGQVAIFVMLVSDGVRHEEEQCVQLCVPVTYEALRRFAKDIHDLLAGGDVARIEADTG